MKPSVGRIVHYVSYGTPGGEYGQECRAAIITAVRPAALEHGRAYQDEDTVQVSLAVLNPEGAYFNQSAPYDQWDSNEALPGACPQGGSWHWPERVD